MPGEKIKEEILNMEKQGTYSHQYKGHIFRKLGSVCIAAEGGGANLKNKRLQRSLDLQLSFCVSRVCLSGEAFINSLSFEVIAAFLCYLDCTLVSGFS